MNFRTFNMLVNKVKQLFQNLEMLHTLSGSVYPKDLVI